MAKPTPKKGDTVIDIIVEESSWESRKRIKAPRHCGSCIISATNDNKLRPEHITRINPALNGLSLGECVDLQDRIDDKDDRDIQDQLRAHRYKRWTTSNDNLINVLRRRTEAHNGSVVRELVNLSGKIFIDWWGIDLIDIDILIEKWDDIADLTDEQAEKYIKEFVSYHKSLSLDAVLSLHPRLLKMVNMKDVNFKAKQSLRWEFALNEIIELLRNGKGLGRHWTSADIISLDYTHTYETFKLLPPMFALSTGSSVLAERLGLDTNNGHALYKGKKLRDGMTYQSDIPVKLIIERIKAEFGAEIVVEHVQPRFVDPFIVFGKMDRSLLSVDHYCEAAPHLGVKGIDPWSVFEDQYAVMKSLDEDAKFKALDDRSDYVPLTELAKAAPLSYRPIIHKVGEAVKGECKPALLELELGFEYLSELKKYGLLKHGLQILDDVDRKDYDIGHGSFPRDEYIKAMGNVMNRYDRHRHNHNPTVSSTFIPNWCLRTVIGDLIDWAVAINVLDPIDTSFAVEFVDWIGATQSKLFDERFAMLQDAARMLKRMEKRHKLIVSSVVAVEKRHLVNLHEDETVAYHTILKSLLPPSSMKIGTLKRAPDTITDSLNDYYGLSR